MVDVGVQYEVVPETIDLTLSDDDETDDEVVIYPKECREISKNRILPTDVETEYILNRYGIDIEKKCTAMQIATISDQRLAWKAINIQMYLCHLKGGMGTYNNSVAYRQTWYEINDN